MFVYKPFNYQIGELIVKYRQYDLNNKFDLFN